MPRTYSFDHFTAVKPATSMWKRPDSHGQRSVSRGSSPLRYGHAHARTEQLYQQHREEYSLQERLPGAEPRPQAQRPAMEEASPMGTAEPRQVDLFGREGLQELGRLAVQSVRRAAREALRGRPLQGMRQLADDALSGTLKVVREASDRTARLASDLSTERAKQPR